MALRDWFKRRSLDEDDFEEEVRSHLAMAVQDRIADGADGEAARRASIKEFGNLTRTTEAARQIWRPQWTDTADQVRADVRYAWRLLVRSPGFSLIVVGVLALGISLNTAVFSVFKGLALAPLAGVPDSGRLGVVMSRTSSGRDLALSYPDFEYLRERSRTLQGVAGSALSIVNIGLGSRSQRVMGEFVTGDYFETLQVRPYLGRLLTRADEVTPGGHPVAVLGHGLWRRAFGADPEIIGQTVYVNAQPLTIVGVTAPTFHGTIVSFDIEVFLPFFMAPQVGLSFQSGSDDVLNDRRAAVLMVLARPAPRVRLASAATHIGQLSAQLAADAPLDDMAQRLHMVPIWESPFGAQTCMLPAVVVLGAMGAILLLVVCANVAGLVLVRGVTRRGELAVRLALGASRSRIVRLLVIENLVLAVPGAALGLLLVWLAAPVVSSGGGTIAPIGIFFNIETDGWVVAFALLTACLSVLGCGLLPAVRTSSIHLASVMKDDLSPRGAARSRLRTALVVSQVAASLFLLVGAGLVRRSLEAARTADAGFDSMSVVSVTADLQPNGYDQTRGRAFYQEWLDAVRAQPGVESATLAALYPMSMIELPLQPLTIDGYAPHQDDDLMAASNIAGSDYFSTLRIGLAAGRSFDGRDTAGGPAVAIVNHTLAMRFWGSASEAIGRRVRLASTGWLTIVGVAYDVKYARIDEAPRLYVYRPFPQAYQSAMMLHVRGTLGDAGLLDLTRRIGLGLEPDLPIREARSLRDQTMDALMIFEMTSVTLLVFGVAGMGLAVMGIYGLVSYAVKQSTREIGIRMALGAAKSDVIRGFLTRGIVLGATGIGCGLAISLGVTRLLARVLYGISAIDPVSFTSAALVVFGSVLVASVVPAWKAARTNPGIALRHQ